MCFRAACACPERDNKWVFCSKQKYVFRVEMRRSLAFSQQQQSDNVMKSGASCMHAVANFSAAARPNSFSLSFTRLLAEIELEQRAAERAFKTGCALALWLAGSCLKDGSLVDGILHKQRAASESKKLAPC